MGQRNLGREFQCNPALVTDLMKHNNRPFELSLEPVDVGPYTPLSPASLLTYPTQRCLLPTASSRACSCHAAPVTAFIFGTGVCTAWKEVRCKLLRFLKELLTEISSVLQSDFGDPAPTAEVVIRHVSSFKVGLHFTEKFP